VSEATEIRSANRCGNCGGPIIKSAADLELESCLICGRPSKPPPPPLALVHEGRPGRAPRRPDPASPLKDQLMALLAEGPMRRSLIYSLVSDGRPDRPRSAEIGTALRALRDLGLVDSRAGGRHQTVWFRVGEGVDGEGVHADGDGVHVPQHGDGEGDGEL
jgi:hypothetical protein